MKRLILMAATLALALWIGTTPAFAQRGHGGGQGASAGTAGSHGMGSPDTHGSSSAANSKSATELLSTNKTLDSTLTAKLQSKGLLPAGTDLKDACSGFSNLGRCISAIHVSHNLRIPFTNLKCDMTGIGSDGTAKSCPAGTSTSKLSLGKAIQTLDPHADANAEAKKASKQADDDMKESESNS